MGRFPFYQQHDSMRLGRKYSFGYLAKLCFATTEGVSLLSINEAANTYIV